MTSPTVPSSHRFLTLDGLMPSTIYDKGDTEMDTSEEMEEIRELLYEMIQKNFSMGVSSTHLAEKYQEEYVNKGLGRELPTDWLEQVLISFLTEEFEAQTRGPLTILFVRLSNTSSFKRPPIPLTNVRIISSSSKNENPDLIKRRKDKYPLVHSETLSTISESLTPRCEVHVVAFESTEDFYIRAVKDEKKFCDIKETLADFFSKDENENRVQIYEILSGGAYALCDAGGEWFRIIAEELPRNGTLKCFFSDVGVKGTFPVRDVRLLPDPSSTIMQTPALAKRVAMGFSSSEVGTETDQIVREIFFENDPSGNLVPVTILFSSADNSSKIDHQTIDLWTVDSRAIKEEVLNRLSGDANGNTKNSIISRASTVVSPSNVCVFSGDADITPMEISQMPVGIFPANALFAAGPMDISLRQVSLDPMPDYMYNKLAEECLLPDSQLTENPQAGLFYAAKIDGRWERVQCIRPSKIDLMAFCVYLIDVGAFHYVRRDSIRKLNGKTPFRKMLMFKCKLSGIQPVGGVDVWSRETHEAVREFFEAGLGDPVLVNPLPNGWSEWKQLNAPAVPLVEARLSCCGRDLADWLISCGLAMPISHEKH
ncbi:unnamed protein product [Auanema sp. JU1783]|nr:unnamed protein product [Auanema sp. JU1783]